MRISNTLRVLFPLLIGLGLLANASSGQPSGQNSSAANSTASLGNATAPAGNPSPIANYTTIPPETIPPNTYPIDPRAPTTVPPGHFADCAKCAGIRAVLQAAIMHFPLLTPSYDSQGHPLFQSWAITNPVVIDGKYYYGFRFTVPPRQHDEAFVWAFVYPFFRYGDGWYMVASNGIDFHDEAGFGFYFQDYWAQPISNYQNLPKLLPTFQKLLYVQMLDGKKISDGATYLIYFGSDKLRSPLHMSVMFTFASLTPDQADDPASMEKVLGLVYTGSHTKKSAGSGQSAPTAAPPTS